MTEILAMREKRVNLWNAAKAFLDTHRVDGVLSAEDENTYNKMLDDIDAMGRQIAAMERAEALEVEMSKPTAQPIVNTPAAKPAAKPGRASDEYKNAFWATMRNRPMTADIYDALQVGTNSEGGYLVPDEFERQLIDGLNEENVLRTIATVIRTAGDRKIPVVASHGTASIIAEEGAYSESDDAFTQIVLGAYKIGTMMKVSEELMADSAFDLQSYIAAEFGRRCGAAEENYFINGTGSGQPTGLLATTGGAGAGATAANAAKLVPEDIFDLFYSVKAPYRRNGSFLMADSTVKELRKMKTGAGDYIWQPALTAGAPDTLMNRPVYTSAYMPTVATGVKAVLFGDFNYFWIADRGAWTFRRLNELYAANGQVGFQGYERVDGKVVLSEAIKVLTMA